MLEGVCGATDEPGVDKSVSWPCEGRTGKVEVIVRSAGDDAFEDPLYSAEDLEFPSTTLV